MNADQPARPANMANIVAINQGRRPLTMEEPAAPALDPRSFAGLLEQGCIVIDTRSSAAFGNGHLPQAYNLHLSSPEFEQRVGWVTPADVPMLLVLEKDEEAAHALHALAFLGLDGRVRGFLAGGMEAWRADGRRVAVLPQITVQELCERRQQGRVTAVLDARETAEWNEGHIEGSHQISYRRLAERLASLPFSREASVAVVCRGGARSSTASSILLHHGYSRVHNVTGGMQAWQAAGLPMSRSPR